MREEQRTTLSSACTVRVLGARICLGRRVRNGSGLRAKDVLCTSDDKMMEGEGSVQLQLMADE